MTAIAQPAADTTTTDRIEKKFIVNAPRSRVWRALTDAKEFGTWFRMKFDRPFAEGGTVTRQHHAPGLRARHGGAVHRAHHAGELLLL